jgi:hypothetical protein
MRGKIWLERLKFGAKLLLVGGLLYFLATKGVIDLRATALAFSRWELVAPGMGLLLVATLLGFVRWRWLLAAQGVEIPSLRALELTLVGNFFNIALPGAVSGDLVKAVYVARESEGKRSSALGSILFDRVAGLSALSLLAAVALLVGWNELDGGGFLPAVRLFVLLPGAAFLVFYAYLFSVGERWDPLLALLRRVEGRFSFVGSFTRIYESLRRYHHHRWTVVRAVALSILIHVCVCCAMALFLGALGEGGAPLSGIFVSVPIGLLATAVPLAPAGIGTGHAAFGWLFRFLGTERGADVFSLFALLQLCVGGVGGLVYLRFRARVRAR